MTFSIGQRLKFLLIKLAINVIWSIDILSYIFFGKKISKALSFLSLLLIAGLLIFISLKSPVIKKQANLFYTGVNSLVYGTDTPKINPAVIKDQNVMGSASIRQIIPVLKNKSAFPYITAKAHLIIDNNSKKILSEHNIYRTFAPASTTKLMTALVALDLYLSEDTITIPSECLEIDSTKIWLPSGGEFLVKDIINSLLISSAGDSACSLAISKVDEGEFVEFMNEKAKKLGMKDTNFTNPIGLDGENGSHFSSVWDLYLLSKEAMKSDFIRQAVKSKEYTFNPIDNEKLEINISNTNKLLWEIPESIGIKTGRTSGAGEVLVYGYKEGVKDLTIIVMSSDDRFLDTKNLLQWTLESFEWN